MGAADNSSSIPSLSQLSPLIPAHFPCLQIYKCREPSCPRPACYKSYPSSKEDDPACEVPGCKGIMKLERHVSFIGAFHSSCFPPPLFFFGLVELVL